MKTNTEYYLTHVFFLISSSRIVENFENFKLAFKIEIFEADSCIKEPPVGKYELSVGKLLILRIYYRCMIV